jgi:hypothetical protein
MNTKSAKAKGRRLQQEVADAIRSAYMLSEDNVRPAIMGESGADIKLSFAAKCKFPFAVECKNQEKLSIWDAIEQAKKHAEVEECWPLVAFRRNRSQTWVAMPLWAVLNATWGNENDESEVKP